MQAHGHRVVYQFQPVQILADRRVPARPAAARLAGEDDGGDAGPPGRRARAQTRRRIPDERSAVEHQLVLSADEIDIGERQPGLGRALGRQPSTRSRLVPLERRAVQHHQQLRAARAEVRRHPRPPHVLADHHPQPGAAKLDRLGQRPGGEHPLLVENAVVRQVVLRSHGRDVAAVQQQRRVMESALPSPGRADQQRRAVVGGVGGERPRRLLDPLLEGTLQHQVLRRVAGQRQLAEHQQVLAARGAAQRADPLDVAVDVADHRIDLREAHRQRFAHRPNVSPAKKLAQRRWRARTCQRGGPISPSAVWPPDTGHGREATNGSTIPTRSTKIYR